MLDLGVPLVDVLLGVVQPPLEPDPVLLAEVLGVVRPDPLGRQALDQVVHLPPDGVPLGLRLGLLLVELPPLLGEGIVPLERHLQLLPELAAVGGLVLNAGGVDALTPLHARVPPPEQVGYERG